LLIAGPGVKPLRAVSPAKATAHQEGMASGGWGLVKATPSNVQDVCGKSPARQASLGQSRRGV